jgi:hypothetical protein
MAADRSRRQPPLSWSDPNPGESSKGSLMLGISGILLHAEAMFTELLELRIEPRCDERGEP